MRDQISQGFFPELQWRHSNTKREIYYKKAVTVEDTHLIDLAPIDPVKTSFYFQIILFLHKTGTVDFLLHHLHWKHNRCGSLHSQYEQEEWLLWPVAQNVHLVTWLLIQYIHGGYSVRNKWTNEINTVTNNRCSCYSAAKQTMGVFTPHDFYTIKKSEFCRAAITECKYIEWLLLEK